MISREFIKELSIKYQTGEDNVIREYCQHLFLSYLNKLKGSEKLLFKGGTALRIIFQSPRFSEDLDFSLAGRGVSAVKEINRLLDDALIKMMDEGMEVEKKLNPGTEGETSGGYFAVMNMKMPEFASEIKIQVSFRRPSKAKGSRTMISNDFIHPYIMNYLNESVMVEEKIEALLDRKMPRDFFDLYFILRNISLIKNIPRRPNLQKDILSVIDKSGDFEKELKLFLPISFHTILKDFKDRLRKEVKIHIRN
ncbi:MAG: nucleotidyl transferase AbiEii/AbiGii toxin family protein [Patescibacteria group bacterium]|jgi:predicted nucleotidyltransferase component of viral defense system